MISAKVYDFDSWRSVARSLIRRGIAPDSVEWIDAHDRQLTFDFEPAGDSQKVETALRVPKRFMDLAQTVARHEDPSRWSVLYRVLWRLVHGEPGLIEIEADADMFRLLWLERGVIRKVALERAGGQEARFALPILEDQASGCDRCELANLAANLVFGEGPPDAVLMIVGDQPDEKDDFFARPFVGSAGRILNRLLAEAGILRRDVYLTHAVKHFRGDYEQIDRIAPRPSLEQVEACRPWLVGEIEAIRPKMIVCLGERAAQALLGPEFKLARRRGKVIPNRWAPWLLVTHHPSALLRASSGSERLRLRRQLSGDFARIRRQLSDLAGAPDLAGLA